MKGLLSISFGLSLVLLLGAGCQPDKPGSGTTPEEPAQPIPETPTIKAINKQIEQHPDNAVLYFNRGNQFLELQQLKPAIRDFQKAISLDSVNISFYHALAQVYFSTSNIKEAINILKLGKRAVPNHPPTLIKLGKYHFYLKEHQKAVNFLNDALKINPALAEAYLVKYLILIEKEDTAAAIANLQTVVELEPENIQAYLELAEVFIRKGDPLALAYIDNALRIDSVNIQALFKKAMYFQQNKNYTEAIRHYKKINRLEPQYEKSFYNLGHIYFQLDSLAQAYKYFEFAIKVSPAYTDAFYMRGLVSEMTGDMDKARQNYHQTLKLDPEHPMATQGIARLSNHH